MHARPKNKFIRTKARFLAELFLPGCLVFLALTAKSQPFGGIVTLSMADFKGNQVTIDSFDSTTNTHSFWQYNLFYHGQRYGIWSNTLSYTIAGATSNSPSRTANVTVATDGSVINVGNAAIAGYVDTAPGGTVFINKNGYVGDLAWVFMSNGNVPGNATMNIQPGHIKDDMNVTFQSLSLPNPTANGWQTTWLPVAQAPTGPTNVIKIGGTWTNISGVWTNIGGTFYTNTSSGWTIGGITYGLVITNRPANSNYVYYSMDKLTASLFIDAPNTVLYLTNGLIYSTSGTFSLNTNSDLQIWTTGDFVTSAGGTINNLTKNVRALSIYDVNGYALNFSFAGNGPGTAYIYAPSSSMQFSGGGITTYDFVGAIFCHDLTVSGHYNFHFDEALGIVLPTPPTILATTNSLNVILPAGSYFKFELCATGPSLNYQWFFNQTNVITDATNGWLYLTNVQPADTGIYKLIVTNLYGSATSPPVSLVVWTDATPTLSAVAMPTNGQFQFNIAGVTGLNYGVQVSTDLVSWIPVATNISPFIFADTNANVSPQRFYRSVYSP